MRGTSACALVEHSRRFRAAPALWTQLLVLSRSLDFLFPPALFARASMVLRLVRVNQRHLLKVLAEQ